MYASAAVVNLSVVVWKAKHRVKKPAMAMKALKKAKKASLKKGQELSAGNLKKLGDLSLKDKTQQAAEEHPDEEETQALVLHQSMSAVEKNNA